MIVRLSAAAGLIAAAIAFGAATASAVPIAPQAGALGAAAAEGDLVQKTQWRYCHRWRDICANRWGWRTWRYFRCTARHGCA
jgi:hypothetical protein